MRWSRMLAQWGRTVACASRPICCTLRGCHDGWATCGSCQRAANCLVRLRDLAHEPAIDWPHLAEEIARLASPGGAVQPAGKAAETRAYSVGC